MLEVKIFIRYWYRSSRLEHYWFISKKISCQRPSWFATVGAASAIIEWARQFNALISPIFTAGYSDFTCCTATPLPRHYSIPLIAALVAFPLSQHITYARARTFQAISRATLPLGRAKIKLPLIVNKNAKKATTRRVRIYTPRLVAAWLTCMPVLEAISC